MNTKWMWITSEADLIREIDEDVVSYPLGTYWDIFSRSIIEYGKLFKAPVLGRSEKESVEHDPSKAPIIGRILRYVDLSPSQAVAYGIPLNDIGKGQQALYAEVELNEEGLTQFEKRRILYTSPRIVFNFMDETGETYPAVIQELSTVGVPFQQLSQVSTWDMPELIMSRFNKELKMSIEQHVEEAEAAVEQVADEAAVDSLETILAILEGLEERIARLETPLEASAEEDEEKVVEASTILEEDEDKTMLAERVKELEEELLERQSEEAVEELMASRFCNSSKQELKSLFKQDRKSFDLVASNLPRKKAVQPSERISRGGTALDPKDPSAVHMAARELQAKENLTYSAALSRIQGAK